MFKLSKSYLLLSLIVVFSFVYRLFLMLRELFPPSADIGLHNSVIYSITQSGNTNFLWNYYHMGEGVSLTFPGYHIFASYIIVLTGMPEYVVHAFAASFFSSFIVLVAFLITRQVWTTSAALLVAFLVTFSRFDIEMLMWGGYPNIVALMLIPLMFYLFLHRKFSPFSFLTSASLISGAIFLTHSLSSIIFIAITFSTFLFVTIFPRRFNLKRAYPFLWLLPLAFGALLVSPFLIDALPVFLGANGNTFVGDASGVRLATLSTQSVATDFVIPLLFYVFIIFLLSKKYKGSFFTVPTLLLSLWILLPAVGSQSYIVGLYTDYNRFRYFVYLPVIILFGVVFNSVSGFFAKIINIGLDKIEKLPNLKKNARKILLCVRPFLSRKPLYVLFVIVLLLYSLSSSTTFAAPLKGIEMQNFYQVMTPPLYDAMQWIKNNTPQDSVLVADALYGWWLSGFTQRQTLSGSEPQYLILSREFEPAKNVKALLDTNYVIDNGLIQVREDGGYIGRHNPLFLANLNNSYFPHGFFHFTSDEITIKCRVNGENYAFGLSELHTKNMHFENTGDSATITLTRSNHLFNVTQTTTVYRGIGFSNMSLTINTFDNVDLSWAQFFLHTKYAQHFEGDNYYALIDSHSNVGAQLIFTANQPDIKVITRENPSALEMTYALGGGSDARIEIFIGVFQIPYNYPDAEIQAEYLTNLILNNTKFYDVPVADLPLDVFNYRDFLRDWNVSYVVLRDVEAMHRFRSDPVFSLVFANEEVTIFKVK